jgi:hypothetical protein
VELRWDYWTCLHCQHNQKETFVQDALLLAQDPDPYYSFSPCFHKKAANINLGTLY